MKPAPFIRHVPRTLEEAVNTLAEFAASEGRVLAGGQSLVPMMAFRMASPAHLIDINEVGGLDRLAVEGDHLSIGDRVRHSAFHKPVTDSPTGRLLADVAGQIAHYPMRTPGYEFSRRAGDFVGCPCHLSSPRRSDCRSTRRHRRRAEKCARQIAQAESILDGQLPSSELFAATGEAAAVAIDPIEDIQTTAEYRRDLVRAGPSTIR
jgi:CO/xanthine dehydrogenase FAD-binding subunit